MGIFDPKTNVSNTFGGQSSTTSGATAIQPTQSVQNTLDQILGGAQYFMNFGYSPDFIQGLNNYRAVATGGNPVVDQAYQTAQGILSPGYATGVDPELQTLLDQNAARTASRVGSSMAGMGRANGSAYADVTGRAITEATAPLLFQNLQDRRNRQMQTMGMAPALDAARYSGAERQLNVANMADNKNWERFVNGAGILGNVGRLGGSLTTTSGNTSTNTSGTNLTPGQSPAQGILGGAIAGGSMFGPLGAIGGGILGGML